MHHIMALCVGWVVLLACFVLYVQASSPRVCIVGSGIAGSSTARFLREANADVEIHVYESRSEIGGRLRTLQFEGVPRPVDAGGSIMHKDNHYIVQFASELGLEVIPMPESSWGIYDGSQFVFESSGFGTVDAGKLWWRYGNDLMKMQKLVKELLTRFAKIYALQASGTSFDSPVDTLEAMELYSLTQMTLEAYMKQQGVSQKLIDEMATAVTRVNYGQDAQMNALAGMIGLAGAGSDLRVVKGGFQQIPKGLLQKAGATVHINTKVEEIVKASEQFLLKLASDDVMECDAVVVAAPLEQSTLQLPPTAAPVVKRAFHRTETTFVRGTVQASLFGKASVPSAIYTTENPKLMFNSIGCATPHNQTDAAYKVFSRAPLTETFLKAAFGKNEVLKIIPWDAYPHFNPPEKFSPFVLERGLIYINTFESAASAMEISAIGGKNAALLLQKWLAIGKAPEVTAHPERVQVEL